MALGGCGGDVVWCEGGRVARWSWCLGVVMASDGGGGDGR